MKKSYLVLALVVLFVMTGLLMAGKGSPQGGYLIWHVSGGHGQFITVDQVGCQVHLASHPDDYEQSPVLDGDCGVVE